MGGKASLNAELGSDRAGCPDESQSCWVGVGLRAAHHSEWLETHPPVDFCEVHAENYFGMGGTAINTLHTIRADYAVSLHSVGIGVGNKELDQEHLGKLRRLVQQVQPFRVSTHLCWNRISGRQFNHLLPLPHTRESLDRVTEHVSRMQDYLGCQVTIEHIASYLRYKVSELSEPEILSALTERTGCGLLLDLTNLHVNCLNHEEDPISFLSGLDGSSVKEIHLAGCHPNQFEEKTIWIDSHDSAVPEDVWQLYETALKKLGPIPTLIERDANIPALMELVEEANRAATIANSCRRNRW